MGKTLSQHYLVWKWRFQNSSPIAVLFVGDILFILDCCIYKPFELLRHVDGRSRDIAAVDAKTKRNAMIRSAVARM